MCTTNMKIFTNMAYMPLQWRHNGCGGVSNHQPHECLLNSLLRRRSKKTPKFRATGLCDVTQKMFSFKGVIMGIPSEIMPCYNCPVNFRLFNQNEILIDFCWWVHLAVIMSLMGIRFLAIMSHMCAKGTLQLNSMFDESKWNPYWIFVVTSSSVTSLTSMKISTNRPVCNTIQDNAISQLSYKFGESTWNLYWVTVLKISSGTDYALNVHEDFGQYGWHMQCHSKWCHFYQYSPYNIPSKIMAYYSCPASLVNQNEIPIDLSS